MRREFGMGAYAIKSKPKIDNLLKDYDIIILDGLYSWEEYIYLINQFYSLILINIFAEPTIRYERLSKRPIRPLLLTEGRNRDIAELEKLNKVVQSPLQIIRLKITVMIPGIYIKSWTI
jgi:hypothetical protein